MRHVKQPYGVRNCGQVAVACLTGKPLEEVEEVVKHQHGTRTKELARVLRAFGWSCPTRCIVAKRFKTLPAVALAQVHSDRKPGWHWIAIENGFVGDGHTDQLGSVEDYAVYLRGTDSRITSYLPLTPPKPGDERPQLYITGTTCNTTKRYPRVTAGPLRNKYIHRIVGAAMVGRPLTNDEQVNHKDGDRRNFAHTNLFILGIQDHGWVSSKQAYYMKHLDAKEKKWWDEFMAEEEAQQAAHMSACKAEGKPWEAKPDGSLREAWDVRQNARMEEQATA